MTNEEYDKFMLDYCESQEKEAPDELKKVFNKLAVFYKKKQEEHLKLSEKSFFNSVLDGALSVVALPIKLLSSIQNFTRSKPDERMHEILVTMLNPEGYDNSLSARKKEIYWDSLKASIPMGLMTYMLPSLLWSGLLVSFFATQGQELRQINEEEQQLTIEEKEADDRLKTIGDCSEKLKLKLDTVDISLDIPVRPVLINGICTYENGSVMMWEKLQEGKSLLDPVTKEKIVTLSSNIPMAILMGAIENNCNLDTIKILVSYLEKGEKNNNLMFKNFVKNNEEILTSNIENTGNKLESNEEKKELENVTNLEEWKKNKKDETPIKLSEYKKNNQEEKQEKKQEKNNEIRYRNHFGKSN